MLRDAVIEDFWIFQDSKYTRFLHMQGLQKVLNMAEYNWIMSEWTVLTTAQFWICLVKVSQGFEYASVLNMPRLKIKQACEHVKVTQATDHA